MGDEYEYEVHAERGLSSVDRYGGEVVRGWVSRRRDGAIWRVFWSGRLRGRGGGVGGRRGRRRGEVRDARDEYAEEFV